MKKPTIKVCTILDTNIIVLIDRYSVHKTQFRQTNKLREYTQYQKSTAKCSPIECQENKKRLWKVQIHTGSWSTRIHLNKQNDSNNISLYEIQLDSKFIMLSDFWNIFSEHLSKSRLTQVFHLIHIIRIHLNLSLLFLVERF